MDGGSCSRRSPRRVLAGTQGNAELIDSRTDSVLSPSPIFSALRRSASVSTSPCIITPRRRPARPIERTTDTHGHEPRESLSDDRQLRRSLPHPNRNAHLAKLIFPAGVSSVAVSLLAGQDTDNQDQFTLSGIDSGAHI